MLTNLEKVWIILTIWKHFTFLTIMFLQFLTILIIYDNFWQFWHFLTILTIFDNFDNFFDNLNFMKYFFFLEIFDNLFTVLTIGMILTMTMIILETCGLSDIEYNSDNWEPEFKTILKEWHRTAFAILAIFFKESFP